ncbi:MAG: hypothetical protein ACOYLI_11865 [Synechococcus lacustris]
MTESIVEYACRVQDKRHGLDPAALEGRRQAREVILEALAEVDLDPAARQRVMNVLRRRKVI